ncbi:hypothetical protein EV128_12565 [Rhizobium azibense]|nr:hypothetical protein EV128_12565 [Rhizobium azibense]
MEKFKFVLRKFLADVIRVAVIILLVVLALMIGFSLFAVGVPFVVVLALVIILSLLGGYIDPRETHGWKFDLSW